jgi:endoglycosylceramidase
VSRVRRIVAIGVALLVITAASGCDPGPSNGTPWPPRLEGEGRWFVDGAGRVVMLRGVNMVEKWGPYYPAGIGFGDDDAAFLADRGFNVVRLGVDWRALMPQPGVIDPAYLENLAISVRDLSRHHVYVLFDFHQDGYGPLTHGNGFPEWATLTDGAPNPNVGFPLYYVQNPAIQKAFDNFWANTPGPDGVGLQDNFAKAARAVAERFSREPAVIGYEAMNEPWPGTDWAACVTGCPELEAELLVPFYERFSTAVTAVDRDAMVFYEPFVLFNFGQADTSLPRISASGALAPHVYALTPADDAKVVDRIVAAATGSGQPAIVGEFGATPDRATLDRLTGELDRGLLPWAFWSYDEQLVDDLRLPPTGANVVASSAAALTRPYPEVTDGTPRSLRFDPATRTLDYTYDTMKPSRERARYGRTSVVVPPAVYPTGYEVAVTGARVVSGRCAPDLVLQADRRATQVHVTVRPSTACRPSGARGA